MTKQTELYNNTDLHYYLPTICITQCHCPNNVNIVLICFTVIKGTHYE